TAALVGFGLASPAYSAPPEEHPHSRDHVLVKLEPGFEAQRVLGSGSEEVFGRWRVQPVPPGKTPQEVVADLRTRNGVEVAELDYVIQLDPVSGPVPLGHVDPVEVDDPGVDYQWHFPAVQLDEAWAQSTGAGVVVAVLDTGISQDGDDLDCHTFVSPYNAIDETTGVAAATDDHGHGTHVAGTVAQCTDNGVGVAGVSFDAALMPVKVLDGAGSGSTSSIARGIDWAHSHGADVINLSLGCTDAECPPEERTIVDEAIEASVKDGIVVVAASGNDSADTVFYPASHPDVVAVGATDYNNERAWYSNGGTELDLMAPGGDTRDGVDENGDGQPDGVLQETFTSQSGWNYYWSSGTSMASPHAAGAAALLLSAEPTLNPAGVEKILECSALDLGSPGFDTSYGHGLIQLHDAFVSLTEPDTTPPAWPSGGDLVAADVTGTSVNLSWLEAHDIGCVARYRIYQDGVQIATTGSASTSTTVSGLTPATSYDFKVRAEDEAGNLGPALSVAVETLDTIPPAWDETDELFVEKFGETSLTLAWDAATDNVGVVEYRLRLAGTTGILTSAEQITATGLEPGSPYLFEVLARDAAGNWSDPLAATVRTARAFTDTPGHTFYNDILWMSGMDITRGCNPPTNDMFCPDDPVTRGQMAAFVVRALGLSVDDHPGFVDVPEDSTFAGDIGRLATAGITRGCNPPTNDMFCPDDPVTRGQMAAFVVRALGLSVDDHPGFVDVPEDSTFAGDIGRLATAGITRGCNPPTNDMFCPDDPITRGQLAAFLHRALD
ncbi:MAG: S8 family serine peptidase, partial [Actinomycetota bacterium]